MFRFGGLAFILFGAIGLSVLARGANAADVRSDIELMKKEIEDLRKNIGEKSLHDATPISSDTSCKVLDNCSCGNAPVKTKSGKLTLGGLVQVWYYAPQHDSRALFDSPVTGIVDSNEAVSNTFRVRRAELTTVMDIHENVTAFVMTDFAREIGGFPSVPSNQGFKSANNISPELATTGITGRTGAIAAVQSGAGGVPNILQDALINFHGFIPHHDFTVGQYLPTFSEEDFGPNGQLDFVERSFIGNIFARDLGATIHGTWWCSDDGKYAGPYCGAGSPGRFQYWFSAFNGAGNYLQSGGQSQNRADDNNDKDFLATLLVRPLWNQETWGSLELGSSGGFGRHGAEGVLDPIATPLDGLNRKEVMATRYSNWMRYQPGGCAKGLWFKGETSWIRDRNAPGTVIDLLAGDADGTGFQTNPNTTHVFGFYTSVGYKFSDSPWFNCGCNNSWLKPFEFDFRYEQFDNVMIASAVNNADTNVYETKVATPGVNYYIKGHNAKIQLNYNFVRNPEGPAYAKFHNVKGDNLVINFQVMF